MNKLLRAILVAHPFFPFFLFKFDPLLARVLALTGIVAVLLIYLFSLNEEKQKVAIPWIWPYILIHSIFLGLPSYCIHISLFFLLYTTIAQIKIDWQYVLKPLGSVCIAVSLLSIMQRLNIRQFSYSFSSHPGLLGNPTDTGMYIAAISPFLLMHKRGLLYFIIPLIAVGMLNSASAMMGISAVLALYLIHKRQFYRELARLPEEVRRRIEEIAFGDDIKHDPFLGGRVQKLKGYREYY